uniref:Putative secreted protein n=1 Tax=Amblyomma triste TaxID=251400 RepID=A0A023G0J5_AMBTT
MFNIFFILCCASVLSTAGSSAFRKKGGAEPVVAMRRRYTKSLRQITVIFSKEVRHSARLAEGVHVFCGTRAAHNSSRSIKVIYATHIFFLTRVSTKTCDMQSNSEFKLYSL